MTDRELLELAAKAVGLQVEWVRNPDYIQEHWEAHVQCGWIGQPTSREWNPLREPSDAFDLMVRLHMHIQVDDEELGRVFVFSASPNGPFEEDTGRDPYAATRRAIVRAAAAIGRA
jgi:hypothetical protein